MSKKKLLEESTVRSFMKLANLQPLSEKFISETWKEGAGEEEEKEEEELDEAKKEEEEEKTWEIYSKKDKHKKKDVNKWYIIPGNILSRYKGEWKDGLAHGKGIREIFGCAEKEHTIFEGTFIEGKFTGYG